MRKIVIECVFLLATATHGVAGTGQIERATNPYQCLAIEFAKLTPIQQINAYRELIRKEFASPTKPRRGAGGGMITHEYQIGQLEIGLLNVLAKPAVVGRAIADPEVVRAVRDLSKEETNPEARELYRRVIERFDNLNSISKDNAEQSSRHVPK